MSEQDSPLGKYDSWLHDDSDVAALVMRQRLLPVDGEGAIIFPPTYAEPQDEKKDRPAVWTGYNIDSGKDGKKICQIDSVGSQANRMEPIFRSKPFSHLVPQIHITAHEHRINLLDAGHRAADAIVRFSELADDLKQAFTSLNDGDAELLAKIAPTSLVFGVWDSRETQVKVPRVVRSVIRAYDVTALHRSAAYSPPIDYEDSGLLEEAQDKAERDRRSQQGFRHAVPSWEHGGIQVGDQIRRDASLNLSAVRALGAGDRDPLPLRRYILGLALLSFTAQSQSFLREGCQLVADPEHPAEWSLVRYDGTRAPLVLSSADVRAYAEAAAESFGVGPDREVAFERQKARVALDQSKAKPKSKGAPRTRPGVAADVESGE